jgi:hypothetical protein
MSVLWQGRQLIELQSVNLAFLSDSLKDIYTVQFDGWMIRQMGCLNPLIQEHVFAYSYASYKSDQRKETGWTSWPLQAIILSGLGRWETREVSAEVISGEFHWRKCYVPGARHVFLSDCFVSDYLHFSSSLSHTHTPSLITNRKQRVLHTSQHLFGP